MNADFVQWINSSLKPWLRIVVNDKLDATKASDLDRGVELCKAEAIGSLGTVAEIKFNSNQLHSNTILINKIYALKNAMGLQDEAGIQFDDRLTIIYGPNGSGKSSYVKLIKKTIDPSISVLPNVFKSGGFSTCYKIDYSINGDSHSFDYPSVSSIPFHVDIYDEEDGKRFIQGDNVISVEPEELVLLKQLSDFADKVKAKLEDEFKDLPNSYVNIPSTYLDTTAGKLYQGFQNKIVENAELNALEMSDSVFGELQNLELSLKNELQEQLLSKNKYDLYHLRVVQNAINLLLTLFGSESRTSLKSMHDAVIEAKKSSAEYAEAVFSNSALGHIGETTWKAMWSAAEKYSSEVYPGHEFPYLEDAAVCVLCHQPLNSENVKKRMLSFKEYIRSDLEQDFKTKFSKWQQLKCFSAEMDFDSISHSLSEIDDSEFNQTKGDFLLDIQKYCEWRKAAVNCPEDLLIDFCNEKRLLVQQSIINKLIDQKNAEISALEKKQTQAEVLEINRKIKELKAKAWVFAQKENIIKHSEEMKKASVLKKAISLTATNGITIKAKDISQQLLDETYVKNFNDAIKMLGAERIKVCLVPSKAQKGRGAYKLVLTDLEKDSKVIDILSSGERRIVSLAAFIADSESGRSNNPFVFDDPVSSLDNTYENAVALSLIQLSETRQMIVFTHRLSLYSSIISLCDKKNKAYKTYMLLNDSLFGSGIVDENPAIICSNVKKSANSICNRIKSENAKCKENPSLIANYVRNRELYCQKFRNLIELSIEMLLFCGIVRRFDKEVKSKKIKWASHISEDDCKFIDDFMSEYSSYDHSQSDENPSPDISYDKLIADYESLARFAEEIKKRQSELGF